MSYGTVYIFGGMIPVTGNLPGKYNSMKLKGGTKKRPSRALLRELYKSRTRYCRVSQTFINWLPLTAGSGSLWVLAGSGTDLRGVVFENIRFLYATEEGVHSFFYRKIYKSAPIVFYSGCSFGKGFTFMLLTLYDGKLRHSIIFFFPKELYSLWIGKP